MRWSFVQANWQNTIVLLGQPGLQSSHRLTNQVDFATRDCLMIRHCIDEHLISIDALTFYSVEIYTANYLCLIWLKIISWKQCSYHWVVWYSGLAFGLLNRRDYLMYIVNWFQLLCDVISMQRNSAIGIGSKVRKGQLKCLPRVKSTFWRHNFLLTFPRQLDSSTFSRRVRVHWILTKIFEW